MKRKTIIFTFALTALLLSGCTQRNVQGAEISAEEAKNLALTHAGLTPEQVTFIKSDINMDNGRKYYDVEFYTKDQQEYDFEIDGYSGDILEWNVESVYANN